MRADTLVKKLGTTTSLIAYRLKWMNLVMEQVNIIYTLFTVCRHDTECIQIWKKVFKEDCFNWFTASWAGPRVIIFRQCKLLYVYNSQSYLYCEHLGPISQKDFDLAKFFG